MGVLSKPSDRRTSTRRPLHEVPQIVEVKLFSEKVTVIDISRGGLLMACSVRLLPSRETRLKVVGVDRSMWVPSRIVRCQVSSLSKERVMYLTAVTFTTPLPWLDDDPELDRRLEAMAASPESQPESDLEIGLDPAFLLNNW